MLTDMRKMRTDFLYWWLCHHQREQSSDEKLLDRPRAFYVASPGVAFPTYIYTRCVQRKPIAFYRRNLY